MKRRTLIVSTAAVLAASSALRQAMARPETPAEFRARVEADLARWRPLAHVVNQS